MHFRDNHPEQYAQLWGKNRVTAVSMHVPVQPARGTQAHFSAAVATGGIMTKDDFFKATPDEQLSFKLNNRAAYDALWKRN